MGKMGRKISASVQGRRLIGLLFLLKSLKISKVNMHEAVGRVLNPSFCEVSFV